MGKRKSASKPQGPKKREGLATSFQCVFCNHENSVTVKLDKKTGTGELSCKICGQTYQTGINSLSAAVDVYSDWIDACDAVAKEAASGTVRAPAISSRGPATSQRARVEEEDDDELPTAEDEAFVENDEVDPEAEYGHD